MIEELKPSPFVCHFHPNVTEMALSDIVAKINEIVFYVNNKKDDSSVCPRCFQGWINHNYKECEKYK